MTYTLSRRLFTVPLSAMALSVVAACGGGGGDAGAPAAPAPAAAAAPAAPPAAVAPIPRVFVAGDSLADVGTFGLKATVQRSTDRAAGYPIYPEIVARELGAAPLCNYFASSDRRTFGTRAGCTDFAVGGAQVVNPVTRGGSQLPLSLEHQLEAAVAASGGAWRTGDLVVVDAGANDAAGLADAYVGALGGGADQAVFLALLAQQLGASTIADALARPDGESVAAGLYMQRLAQTYWDTVRAQTLDKGATRVALLNVPDISLTPRLRNIAAGVAATDGPAAAAAFQAGLRQWIVGFNTELARLVAGEPRVALVPYYDDFSAQNSNPAAFGLTNATAAACPPEGEFEDCTDAALDASPPTPGLGAGWWKTWAFSDAFHPSPRGHELLAATVLRALARAGWR